MERITITTSRRKKMFIASLFGILSIILLSYFVSNKDSQQEMVETPINGYIKHQHPTQIYESIGDLCIALAYFSIPLEMFFYYRRYPLPQFVWVFALFIAFITLCGLTHLFHLFFQETILQTVTKILTAIVSCVTAVYLLKFIPAALALQKYAFELEEEIVERVKLSEFLRETIKRGETFANLINRIRGIEDTNAVLNVATNVLQNTFQSFGCVVINPNNNNNNNNEKKNLNNMYVNKSIAKEELTVEVSKIKVSPMVSTDEMIDSIKRIIPRLGHDDKRIVQFISDPKIADQATKSTSITKDFYTLLTKHNLKNNLINIENEEFIEYNRILNNNINHMNKESDVYPSLYNEQLQTIALWEPNLKKYDIDWLTRIKIQLPNQSFVYILLFNISHHRSNDDKGYLNREQLELLDLMSDQMEIALSQSDFMTRDKDQLQELTKKNEELLRARETAERATKVKSEFIAVVSHEIRTPMYAVCAFTELLLMETSINRKQRELLASIQASGKLLLALVNDILDFSKYERGDFDLENSPFHLRRCVEQCVDMVSSRIAEKNVEIGYVFSPPVPELIIGDVTRFRQIIVNLLSNSVKFTQSGEIALRISVEEDRSPHQTPLRASDPLRNGSIGNSNEIQYDNRENRVKINVEVQDTGIGISEDKIPILFKMFSQVDSSTTREFGGTGLGLAICKLLIQKMGGDIIVQSEEGKGSIFKFNIYLSTPSPVDIPSISNIEEHQKLYRPSNDLHHKVVLIATKLNSIVTSSLVEMLQSCSLIPIVCSIENVQNYYANSHQNSDNNNNNKFFEPARRSSTHSSNDLFTIPSNLNNVLALFIDYHLQVECTENPKKQRVINSLQCISAKIPIIALTKNQNFSDEPPMDIFSYVLPKPLRLHNILGALDQIQFTSKAQNTLNEISEKQIVKKFENSRPSSPTQISNFKPLGLRLLVTEDNVMNQKVTIRLLEKLGCVAEIASNGQIAIDKIFGDSTPIFNDINYNNDEGSEGNGKFSGQFSYSVNKYDAVLMDINMPVLDGISATREICKRARALRCTVPYVIGTTAAGLHEDEKKCIAAGMRDFLRKPVGITDLYNALSKITENRDKIWS